MAERLLSQFPPKQGVDPKAFMTALVAVMLHYPPDVCRLAADPYFGLPSLQNWTPTPYDLKQFCEKAVQARRNEDARWQRIERQLSERSEPDRSGRPSLNDIGAQMAARGVYLPSYIKNNPQLFDRKGEPHGESPDTVCAKLKITRAEFDALPPTRPGRS